MTRRLIADVDTGIDDMLALVYLAGLHRLGEVELAAVTATAGNTTVCRAAANSRLVLDLVGLSDVPVAAGYGAPLRVPLVTTPETHGEFGLGFVRPPNAAEMERIIDADDKENNGHFANRPRHTQQLDYYRYVYEIEKKELPAGARRAAQLGPVDLAGKVSA